MPGIPSSKFSEPRADRDTPHRQWLVWQPRGKVVHGRVNQVQTSARAVIAETWRHGADGSLVLYRIVGCAYGTGVPKMYDLEARWVVLLHSTAINKTWAISRVQKSAPPVNHLHRFSIPPVVHKPAINQAPFPAPLARIPARLKLLHRR
jgi:hypothetical protein